jgi:fucose 4-O-acetylase-like acetyltransferase
MSTPLIREAAWVTALPDPVEWYLRPSSWHTSFVLFPWAGFLFAGAICGELVDAARTKTNDGRLQLTIAAIAAATVGGGYWASLQPSIYPVSNFWLSSPTFFFIRLGLAMALVPMTWVLEKTVKPLGFLEVLGRSSLFVYWIHVEMVYGVIAKPLERLLPLELSLLGTVALCALLLAIVRWKNQLMRSWQLTGPFRLLTPVLR